MRSRHPLTDTASRYGGPTRLWHWLTAALVLVAVPLGLVARRLAAGLETAEGAELTELIGRTAASFSWHKTLGLTVLVLALLRLFALGSARRRPDLIHGARGPEAFAARMVQAMLALGVLLVPLTGWLIHSASTGAAPHLLPLPQRLPLVPEGPGAAGVFTALHRTAIVVLTGALLLHAAGALRHHFVDRDATLLRMALGRDAPGSRIQPPPHAPARAAAAFWALALTLGGLTGAAPLPEPPADRAPQGSPWEVTEGEIRLTVRQFGREIRGDFPDWTARIAWDPEAVSGPAGHVTVRIAIPSLTIGPLTAQALGSDFFDARNHETAVFDATLLKVTDGQRAEGTLLLRGVTRPVSFPFRLAIEDGVAYAGARLTLDRRDFDIGAALPDAGTLAHEVIVDITLRARRGP